MKNSTSPLAALIRGAACLGVVAALLPTGARAADEATARGARADFAGESASRDTRQVADWIVDSADNAGKPFIVIDKRQAKVFLFRPDGRLDGAAPALLGLAIGDHTVPGIADRPLSSIRPDERTTPAGRFVASLGRNLHEEILWVDYDSAVSLHRVVRGTPAERRAQRLASATPLDNRISYGCINVPAKFYEERVSPAFTGTEGIVYVLPEVRTLRQAFTSYYDVDDLARRQDAMPEQSAAR